MERAGHFLLHLHPYFSFSVWIFVNGLLGFGLLSGLGQWDAGQRDVLARPLCDAADCLYPFPEG